MNLDSIVSGIANGFVNGFIVLFEILVGGILDAVQSILDSFGSTFIGPLNTWAIDVAAGNGVSIPIIFTLIFGISIFILLFFIDIFGLEKDIDEGLGGLMEI